MRIVTAIDYGAGTNVENVPEWGCFCGNRVEDLKLAHQVDLPACNLFNTKLLWVGLMLVDERNLVTSP